MTHSYDQFYKFDLLKKNIYIYIYIYKFIYFWLHWVFVAECGLSLVAVSGGYFSLQCAGFSLWWLVFLAEHGL